MSINVNSKTTVKKEDKTNITNYNSRLSQNLHINNTFLLDDKGLGERMSTENAASTLTDSIFVYMIF